MENLHRCDGYLFLNNPVSHFQLTVGHVGKLLVVGDDDKCLASFFTQLEE